MKVRRWVRARGSISQEGGPQPHLCALAYMSDRWFIGTAWAVHMAALQASLGAEPAPSARPLPGSRDKGNQPTNSETPSTDPREKGASGDASPTPQTSCARDGHSDQQTRLPQDPPLKIGMMVSLDHSIYFHRPLGFRVDDWLLTEMDSPWVGDGRGFVTQRIFDKDGVLVATCVQEVSLSVMCFFSWGSFILSSQCFWRHGSGGGPKSSTRVMHILILLFLSCSWAGFRRWILVLVLLSLTHRLCRHRALFG